MDFKEVKLDIDKKITLGYKSPPKRSSIASDLNKISMFLLANNTKKVNFSDKFGSIEDLYTDILDLYIRQLSTVYSNSCEISTTISPSYPALEGLIHSNPMREDKIIVGHIKLNIPEDTGRYKTKLSQIEGICTKVIMGLQCLINTSGYLINDIRYPLVKSRAEYETIPSYLIHDNEVYLGLPTDLAELAKLYYGKEIYTGVQGQSLYPEDTTHLEYIPYD